MNQYHSVHQIPLPRTAAPSAHSWCVRNPVGDVVAVRKTFEEADALANMLDLAAELPRPEPGADIPSDRIVMCAAAAAFAALCAILYFWG